MLLLVLWVVPYVPGVGREWPLLLVLAGPTKWVIAALAMLGLLWAWVAAAARRLSTVAASRRLLFTTAFVLFLAGGVTTIRTMGPGGDEPHYLIIAHSLIRDGDLQIENNHTQRDHASFFGGALPPHYLTRGRNGVIYSVHAPGLPAVLAPAYAAAGYPGAVVMMVTLAAFLTVAMYDLARQVAGDGSARLTWAVTTVTVPMIPLAWMIYPEVAAALLVAWGARWIVEPVSAAGWRWAVRGLALAAMPWLHTKFAILLACLGDRSRRATLAPGASPGGARGTGRHQLHRVAGRLLRGCTVGSIRWRPTAARPGCRSPTCRVASWASRWIRSSGC